MPEIVNSNIIRKLCDNGKIDEAQRLLATNLGITVEQYRYLDEQMHAAMGQILVGRKLVRIRPLDGGIGLNQYSYDTISQMSAAMIGDILSENSDLPNLTRTNVPIRVIDKTYEVNARHNGVNGNMTLTVAAQRMAAVEVAQKDDEYIIKGWAPDGSTYVDNGLYNAANNDYNTGSNWGTATNISASINGALALLNADYYYGPFNLVLHPTQFNEARVFIGDTDTSYLEWIKKQIGGEIFVTDNMTAGTGMLVATPDTKTKLGSVDGGYWGEYVLPVDWTHEEEILPKSHNWFGRVYETAKLIVYDTNAICKISVI